jgi:vesicle-fusing ATPase
VALKIAAAGSGVALTLRADVTKVLSEGASGEEVELSGYGRFRESTDVRVHAARDGPLSIEGQSSKRGKSLFQGQFDFQALGIGGLDTEFQVIFRDAFMSRMLAPEVVERMGLPHVKGIVLYGAPGCGKTLIARQLGKVLNAREPKVVNGPEILNKYVG